MRAFVASLLLVAACSRSDGNVQVLANGMGRNLEVAPGNGAAAFLLDTAHPNDRSVPDDLVLGELWLAPLQAHAPLAASTGGAAPAKSIGTGVPSTPGAVAFSPDGTVLAFLAQYRFRTGEGELWTATPGSAPKKLADGVASFAWAPAGHSLAYVANGRLVAMHEGSLVPLLEGVQAFAWSPDGRKLAARAPGSAGGKAFLLDANGGDKRELRTGTTDFAFAADGALALLGPAGPQGGDRELQLLEPGAQSAKVVGRATSFGFTPDGKTLLLLSTERTRGESFGELSRLPRAGTLQELGPKVSEWRATPSGALVFLANYDVRARAGTLLFAPPDGAPRELGKRVQLFQLAPAGDRVHFVVQKPEKGDFKLELWETPLPAGEARKVDEGVYGLLHSKDGATLFYKARCAGGRSCTLFRAPADASAPPTPLATNVVGFDLSNDGQRLLVALAHRGAPRAVDLAILPAAGKPSTEPLKPFALEVDPGARFADDQGTRVLAARLTAHEGAVLLTQAR